MKYTAETVKRTIVGSYAGKHIAGTSNEVYDALATIEYRFDGYTVTLSDIPVRWDAERKRQLISGSVGVQITRTLEDISYTIERQQLEHGMNRLLAHRAMLEEQLEHLQEEFRDMAGQPPEHFERLVREAVLSAPVRTSIKVSGVLSPAA